MSTRIETHTTVCVYICNTYIIILNLRTVYFFVFVIVIFVSVLYVSSLGARGLDTDAVVTRLKAFELAVRPNGSRGTLMADVSPVFQPKEACYDVYSITIGMYRMNTQNDMPFTV